MWRGGGLLREGEEGKWLGEREGEARADRAEEEEDAVSDCRVDGQPPEESSISSCCRANGLLRAASCSLDSGEKGEERGG